MVNLVSCSPFFDSKEALSEVCCEEAQRWVMVTIPQSQPIDGYTIISWSDSSSYDKSNIDPPPNYKGDHYQRHGNSRSTC